MSGDHAKKEMVTGDKPVTSHEKGSIGRVPQQGEGEGIPFTQVASEWRKEEEDEEGGLLRDRLFIAINLRLRCAVRNF
jgi:hypothetical protein